MGGRVVIPRVLDLERGRLRQRFGGTVPSRWRARPRAGGRMVVVPTGGSPMRRVDRKPMSRAMAMRGLLLPSPRNPRPRSGPPAARRRRVRTCMPACVRFLQAACGLACGPARAACRPACGFARPDSAAPTPLLPLRIGSLADGELRRAERNLGKYWSNDLKFSHCASDGLESEATALCRAYDHRR